MTTRTAWLRALTRVGATTLVLVSWALFAPQAAGGAVSYVVVNGASMEPEFHSGDLVIARASDAYQVGDVAVYRDPHIGPVIHRIVAEQDGRYTFKGDNNAWRDTFHPARADLAGKLWLYAPRLGGLVMALRQPHSLAVAVAVATLVVVMMCLRGKPRWPERKGAQPERWSIPMGNKGLSRDDLLLVTLVAGALSIGLGLFAFSQPLTREEPVELSYDQQGVFYYSADDPDGIYDNGIVQPGEPVFRKFANAITVTFAYRLASTAVHDIYGSVRMLAEVSDPAGWKRTIELAPVTAFMGNVYQQEVHVNLQTFQSLIDNMEKLTGVHNALYTLAIMPQVSVVGVADNRPWQSAFTPHLDFSMDDAMLTLANHDPQAPITTQLTQTGNGKIQKTVTQPNSVTFIAFPVNVLAARITAGFGMLLAVVGFTLATWRSRRANPVEQIESAHGKYLVSTDHIQLQGNSVVDVATIDDLVKLAERDSRMVLHIHDGTRHLYVVQDGSTHYQYTLNDVTGHQGDAPYVAQT